MHAYTHARAHSCSSQACGCLPACVHACIAEAHPDNEISRRNEQSFLQSCCQDARMHVLPYAASRQAAVWYGQIPVYVRSVIYRFGQRTNNTYEQVCCDYALCLCLVHMPMHMPMSCAYAYTYALCLCLVKHIYIYMCYVLYFGRCCCVQYSTVIPIAAPRTQQYIQSSKDDLAGDVCMHTMHPNKLSSRQIRMRPRIDANRPRIRIYIFRLFGAKIACSQD